MAAFKDPQAEHRSGPYRPIILRDVRTEEVDYLPSIRLGHGGIC